MCVLFARGMFRRTTARSRIRGAISLMRSGVSRSTPEGAAFQVSSVGFSEWQVVQRCSTIIRAVANETGGPVLTCVFTSHFAVSMYTPMVPKITSDAAAGNHAG